MLNKFFGKLKNILLQLLAAKKTPILEQYIKVSPDPQHTVDIFKNEWSSKFPENSNIIGGNIELYNDARINWAIKLFGGVKDKTVLELGPLEAGHTYMLHKQGAKSILSVEANTRAYLKCLIARELFELTRAKFLCGDFVQFMRQSKQVFDITLASGVLYHMKNPVELIELIGKCTTNAAFVWTHYYDEKLFTTIHANKKRKFVGSTQHTHAGFDHTLNKHLYLDELGWQGFCGGSAEYSCWLSKQTILDAFSHFGFSSYEINFDDENHQNGPAFAFVAYK